MNNLALIVFFSAGVWVWVHFDIVSNSWGGGLLFMLFYDYGWGER